MVNLYIHERREGDVAVLDLKGRIRIKRRYSCPAQIDSLPGRGRKDEDPFERRGRYAHRFDRAR